MTVDIVILQPQESARGLGIIWCFEAEELAIYSQSAIDTAQHDENEPSQLHRHGHFTPLLTR